MKGETVPLKESRFLVARVVGEGETEAGEKVWSWCAKLHNGEISPQLLQDLNRRTEVE